MKAQRHFTIRWFLVVLVVFLTGIFSASVVLADPYIPEKKVYYMDGTSGVTYIYLHGVTKTSAITNLKTSKKSVAKVFKDVPDGKTAAVAILPKKAGTTTITFKVKYNGKTIKGKTKFIARKYSSPLKSFKVGSKNFTSKFKKTGHLQVDKALKGKLSIKLKSGYKISQMSIYSWSGGSFVKEPKNNKSVNVPKGKTLSVQVIPEGADETEKMFLEIMVNQ